MSNNNQAKNHQNVYDDIKKYDVNAMRAFLYTSTKDVTDALDYWSKRRITIVKVADQAANLAIIDLEIMRLESILLARTQYTLDFFKISDIGEARTEAEALSAGRMHFDKNFPESTAQREDVNLPKTDDKKEKKRWGFLTLENLVKDKVASHKTDETIKSEIEEVLLGNIVDLGDNKIVEITTKEEFEKYFNTNFAELLKAGEESKTVQMIPQQIKQSVLAEHCKKLLTENKREEAFTFAKGYLANAAYIPTKEKKKPEKWHDARINSWLDDLAKNIKPEKQNKPSDKKKEEPIVDAQTDLSKEEETPTVDISVSMEDYDKFEEWLKTMSLSLDQVLPEDLIEKFKNPENRKEYGSIIFTVDKEKLEDYLDAMSQFGINAMEVVDEETSKSFENTSITLSEEIEHIDNLLNQCHELRGSDEKEAANLDKIEELLSLFYGTRGNAEYKDKKEFIKLLKDRPKIIKTSKDFFSQMCPKKIEALSEGKEQNLYKKITDEIKSHAFDKEDDLNSKFLPKIVDKLKHKTLMGKTSDGKNLVIKSTFYTTYHVLFFVDQIIESARQEAEAAKKGEAAATADDKKAVATASTTLAAGASEKSAEQGNTLKETSDLLEETILNVIKSHGVVEDVLLHPTVVEMKGKEFADPWETGKLILNDENYEKFINKKFEEIAETYKSTLTGYPYETMIQKITSAHAAGVSAEDFVKEGIEYLRKKDGSFLPLIGTVDKVEVKTSINSDKDLLKYVKEIYDLQDKLKEEEEAEKSKYELSEFKTYLEFEATVKAQAAEQKMTLEELKTWVKERILDKRFSEEKGMLKPMFTSEYPDNLENWVEIVTRKEFETPESREATEKKLNDFIKEEGSKSTLSFISFLHEVRSFCYAQKIDTNLRDLRAKTLEIIKESNKAMYDKYIATRKDLKDAGLISDEVKTPPALKSKKEETPVIIPSDKDENPIEKALLTVTSEEGVANLLKSDFSDVKFKANAIKALKTLICDKHQQIANMPKEEAAINEWINKFYALPAVPEQLKDNKVDEGSGKEKTETRIDFVPDMVKDKEFETLAGANDKHPFKIALANIISKYEDSSELRAAIVATINNGKGKHTIKVAKQDVSEHHKMIKKAFENYEEGKKK